MSNRPIEMDLTLPEHLYDDIAQLSKIDGVTFEDYIIRALNMVVDDQKRWHDEIRQAKQEFDDENEK